MSKILLVEDDNLLRRAYHTKLGMEGYEIEEAYDGQDALNKVEVFKPELILLDLLMPNMNGIEFLKAYQPKTKHPEVKIIVFSNWSVPEKIEEAMGLGAHRYLVKASISPKDMARIIKETLAGDQPASTSASQS